MKRSLFGLRGSSTWNFMVSKKSTAVISAIEQQEVGCPDPALLVAWMESMRSRLAMSFKAATGRSLIESSRERRDRTCVIGDLLRENGKRVQREKRRRTPSPLPIYRLASRMCE